MFTNPRQAHSEELYNASWSLYSYQDATTNPSLLLAAANKPAYSRLIDVAIAYGRQKGGTIQEQVDFATDRLVKSIP